jgi:putative SOS response-associated peptidase YedK
MVIDERGPGRIKLVAVNNSCLYPTYIDRAPRCGATGTINAKSETAATKPAFRDPLKFRRCLIPPDGFYEWKRTAAGKQPFCFEVNSGDLFAFAGL